MSAVERRLWRPLYTILRVVSGDIHVSGVDKERSCGSFSQNYEYTYTLG